MRATEHAPPGPFYFLERRHGLAEVVECGAGVNGEHRCVTPPHLERDFMTLSKNAPRHGRRFAHQGLSFFQTPHIDKGERVVVGCCYGRLIFLAIGRPPRPPGFKKRPNTAGAQPMGGLPIEEFLAVMNGGDSGDLVGKLMQLGISLASNAG